jgi:hypothetical protein
VELVLLEFVAMHMVLLEIMERMGGMEARDLDIQPEPLRLHPE